MNTFSGRAVPDEFGALGFIWAAVQIAVPLTAGAHLALEQVQLQIVAMFLLPTVHTLILGFIRPIWVDNGTTRLENQCARSDGESVSGCKIRERV
jgi:hypothetical protein